jgi:flagellar assembly protein FliH
MMGEAVRTFEVFQYEDSGNVQVAAWARFDEAEMCADPTSGKAGIAAYNGEPPRQELEDKLTEEVRRSFEAGRERGLQEGRLVERDALAATRQAEESHLKAQVAELVQRLAEDGERYLHSIEHEVVRLALAVAARILRREAQMDPLLLTGAVRVALGQLSSNTEVRLRVPASEIDLWREAIAHLPNLNVKPLVEAGEDMRMGDCLIETSVGTVDLGIRCQLAEIERGFFDRAGQHSTAPPSVTPSAQPEVHA